MKLLTFLDNDQSRLGALTTDGLVLDLTTAWRQALPGAQAVPESVGDLILLGDEGRDAAQRLIEAHAGKTSLTRPQDETRFLAPIPRPARNIFCVGRNYREHIIEGNLARGRDPNDFPKAIEFFTKPPSTVVGHGAPVLRHAHATNLLDYEVELAIVIGRGGRDIPRDQALAHVFGYTVLNDVTGRDLQARHGQWFKGKSLDTSCPIGPVVTTRDEIPDPHVLNLTMTINGEPRQDANTSSLLFGIGQIIEQLSLGMALQPGDIIATGTPSGVGLGMQPPRSLEVGDVMVARVEGIGELRNTIVGE